MAMRKHAAMKAVSTVLLLILPPDLHYSLLAFSHLSTGGAASTKNCPKCWVMALTRVLILDAN